MSGAPAIRSTTLSTVIGDNIGKYSQPKYPIFKIGYILTYQDPYDDMSAEENNINIVLRNKIVEVVPDSEQPEVLKNMEEKKYGDIVKVMLKTNKATESFIKFMDENLINYDLDTIKPIKVTIGNGGLTNEITPWGERGYTFIRLNRLA